MTLRFIKFSKHATISAAQTFWAGGNEKEIFPSSIQHFPHLYNTQENNMLESKKHLMRLPYPSYYDVNNMHKEARDKFLQ